MTRRVGSAGWRRRRPAEDGARSGRLPRVGVVALLGLLAGSSARTPLVAQALECADIDVGGRSTFACVGGASGANSPTVVFEAGMRDDHRAWTEVAPAVAEWGRIVTYDRAGNGRSDPSRAPRTPAAIARELRDLLRALELPPPFLLVAHSAGGWHARTFARLYSDEVAGLLLLDTPHEEFEPRRLEILSPDERSARMRALSESRAALPDAIRREYEGLDAARSTYGPLGDMPLLVVTAERHEWGSRGDAAELETVWRQLQGELSGLSSRGRLVVVPEVGHQIPRQRPDLVISWVREMLTEPTLDGR